MDSHRVPANGGLTSTPNLAPENGQDARILSERLIYQLLNELTVAVGRISFAQESPDLPETVQDHLHAALSAFERAAMKAHALHAHIRGVDQPLEWKPNAMREKDRPRLRPAEDPPGLVAHRIRVKAGTVSPEAYDDRLFEEEPQITNG